MEYPFQPNSLYYGDCLEVLVQWPDTCVDLIYLDPPFNSKQNYNVLFREDRQQSGRRSNKKNGRSRNGRTQVRAYEDTWFWNAEAQQRVTELKRASTPVGAAIRGMEEILGESGMLAYLSYMAQRLIECRRVLKETGSLYLHCDSTAGHYLKVVLDSVFGAKQFRNEIVWSYGGRGAKAIANQFPRNHDLLFLYGFEKGRTHNRIYQDVLHPIDQLPSHIRIDENGRAFKTSPRGDYTDESIERLECEGRIHRTSTGNIRIKYYLEIKRSSVVEPRLIGSVWSDIPDMMHTPKSERTGYPTQKPHALLERIIRASSNQGDIVLDPFIGSGTTAEAAAGLNRRFVGIDIASFALDLARKQLDSHSVVTYGVPQHLDDAARLVRENAFAFEKWAIERIPGLLANQVQVGDGGIDGVGRVAFPLEGVETDLVLAQVKGGQFRPNDLRAFRGVMASEEATLGIFITLRKVVGQQRRNADAEQADFGSLHQGVSTFPRLQLWSIEEYFEDRFPQLPILAHPYTGKALEGPLL